MPDFSALRGMFPNEIIATLEAETQEQDTTNLIENILQLTNGSTEPVSLSGQGKLRYNEVLNQFEVSENGGAWTDLATAGATSLQAAYNNGNVITLNATPDPVTIQDTTDQNVIAGLRLISDTAGTGVLDQRSPSLQFVARTGAGDTQRVWDIVTGTSAYSSSGERDLEFLADGWPILHLENLSGIAVNVYGVAFHSDEFAGMFWNYNRATQADDLWTYAEGGPTDESYFSWLYGDYFGSYSAMVTIQNRAVASDAGKPRGINTNSLVSNYDVSDYYAAGAFAVPKHVHLTSLHVRPGHPDSTSSINLAVEKPAAVLEMWYPYATGTNAQATSVEWHDIALLDGPNSGGPELISLRTTGAHTQPLQRTIRIDPRGHEGNNVTVTDGYTMWIGGAPFMSTGTSTFTNAWAAGFMDPVQIQETTASAVVAGLQLMSDTAATGPQQQRPPAIEFVHRDGAGDTKASGFIAGEDSSWTYGNQEGLAFYAGDGTTLAGRWDFQYGQCNAVYMAVDANNGIALDGDVASGEDADWQVMISADGTAGTRGMYLSTDVVIDGSQDGFFFEFNRATNRNIIFHDASSGNFIYAYPPDVIRSNNNEVEQFHFQNSGTVCRYAGGPATTLTQHRSFRIGSTTLEATASDLTVADAYSFYVDDVVFASGGNVSITRPWAAGFGAQVQMQAASAQDVVTGLQLISSNPYVAEVRAHPAIEFVRKIIGPATTSWKIAGELEAHSGWGNGDGMTLYDKNDNIFGHWGARWGQLEASYIAVEGNNGIAFDLGPLADADDAAWNKYIASTGTGPQDSLDFYAESFYFNTSGNNIHNSNAERVTFYFDNNRTTTYFGSGTMPKHRNVGVTPSGISATNPGLVITDAYALHVEGAPFASGGNVTVTNEWTAGFQGPVKIYPDTSYDLALDIAPVNIGLSGRKYVRLMSDTAATSAGTEQTSPKLAFVSRTWNGAAERFYRWDVGSGDTDDPVLANGQMLVFEQERNGTAWDGAIADRPVAFHRYGIEASGIFIPSWGATPGTDSIVDGQDALYLNGGWNEGWDKYIYSNGDAQTFPIEYISGLHEFNHANTVTVGSNTETTPFFFNSTASVNYAGGPATTLATHRHFRIDAPALQAVSGTLTVTDAYTFYVAGVPADGGANITLTNQYAAGFAGGVILEDPGVGGLYGDVYLTDTVGGVWWNNASAAEFKGIDAGSSVGNGIRVLQDSATASFDVDLDGTVVLQVNPQGQNSGMWVSHNLIVNGDATSNNKVLDVTGSTYTSADNTERVRIELDAGNTTYNGGAATIGQHRDVLIEQNTLNATTTGFTITDAYSFYVAGAPVDGGANITLTNAWAAGFNGAVDISPTTGFAEASDKPVTGIRLMSGTAATSEATEQVAPAVSFVDRKWNGSAERFARWDLTTMRGDDPLGFDDYHLCFYNSYDETTWDGATGRFPALNVIFTVDQGIEASILAIPSQAAVQDTDTQLDYGDGLYLNGGWNESWSKTLYTASDADDTPMVLQAGRWLFDQLGTTVTVTNNTQADAFDINPPNWTYSGGAATLPQHNTVNVQTQTLNATTTGFTVTDAYSFYVAGVPADGGANITLTRAWALGAVGPMQLDGGLVLKERADHSITPYNDYGELWLKNDATQKLFFTDDAGVDHDLTNRGHGEIYVYGYTGSQTTNATPGNFDIVTAFNTASGFNGSSYLATNAKASNKITLNKTGKWFVSFSCSFGGTGNSTFNLLVYMNGVAQNNVRFSRKLGAGGDVGRAACNGIITATAGQDLDVRVASDGTSDTFSVKSCNLNATFMGVA